MELFWGQSDRETVCPAAMSQLGIGIIYRVAQNYEQDFRCIGEIWKIGNQSWSQRDRKRGKQRQKE